MGKQPKSQAIGHKIKNMSEDDRIRVSNEQIDETIIGTVTKTNTDGNGFHEAIIEKPDGKRYRIHANWRDIPESNPNKDPYTGLIEYDKNDTAPLVTELQILSY